LIAVPVRADDGGSLTDAQVSTIRQNCTQAQSTLQRLQSTDVATRVSRGQIYENLLSRLIEPFNTRVDDNSYDATQLLATTSDLTGRFNDFKTDYSSYADSFTGLLSMNCVANPRGFYGLLATVREKRTLVATDIADLDSGLSKYEAGFTTLRSSIENGIGN
jgi:hypothetical protein